MSSYSVCGIDCDACKHKAENDCKGCKKIKGTVFWGECDLYKCCLSMSAEHCGRCTEFPCATLKEWSVTENPERIENLKKLIGS